MHGPVHQRMIRLMFEQGFVEEAAVPDVRAETSPLTVRGAAAVAAMRRQLVPMFRLLTGGPQIFHPVRRGEGVAQDVCIEFDFGLERKQKTMIVESGDDTAPFSNARAGRPGSERLTTRPAITCTSRSMFLPLTPRSASTGESVGVGMALQW